jgi:uncharacterized protein
MAIDPVIGLVFRRDDIEARPAIAADLSTIGLVGPMPDADPTTFPLDTPVKVFSNDLTTLAKVGTLGFIPDAIDGIDQQLGELQRSAQIVIVRTAEGTNADPALKLQQTIGNIIGSSLNGTGVWAFLLAGELVGAYPRIILAPGYTGQQATGLDTITQSDAGSGYVQDRRYELTFGSAGANSVPGSAYALGQADGTLGPAVIESFGAYMTAVPTVTAPAPTSGTTATYSAATAPLGNPVVASMDSVLNQILAHAIAESSGTSLAQDETYRETINSQRIIVVTGGVKIAQPVTGTVVVRPLAPRMAGAMVRRDYEKGSPFYSACNQPIRGILGPSRRIKFSLFDGANEGQALLAANIGFLSHGEVGDDFQIASGGYVILSTDNAGEDELWRFYNQTRGRDFLNLTLARAERFYLGRFNITPQTVLSIIAVVKNVLRDLQAADDLLGFDVGFMGNLNSPEEVRKGNITISFKAEEPAPLRKITNRHGRYRQAVVRMVESLETQLAIAA